MKSRLVYLLVRVGAVALVWALLYFGLSDPDTSSMDAMGAGMTRAFHFVFIFLVVFVGGGLIFAVEAVIRRRRGQRERMRLDVGLAVVLLGTPLVLFVWLLLLG